MAHDKEQVHGLELLRLRWDLNPHLCGCEVQSHLRFSTCDAVAAALVSCCGALTVSSNKGLLWCSTTDVACVALAAPSGELTMQHNCVPSMLRAYTVTCKTPMCVCVNV